MDFGKAENIHSMDIGVTSRVHTMDFLKIVFRL